MDETYSSILSLGVLMDPSTCRWNPHGMELTDVEACMTREKVRWLN